MCHWTLWEVLLVSAKSGKEKHKGSSKHASNSQTELQNTVCVFSFLPKEPSAAAAVCFTTALMCVALEVQATYTHTSRHIWLESEDTPIYISRWEITNKRGVLEISCVVISISDHYRVYNKTVKKNPYWAERILALTKGNNFDFRHHNSAPSPDVHVTSASYWNDPSCS